MASLVSGVVSMVFAVPLASAMLFVMYVDQRVRGEGLTMHALARELGVPEGFAAGAAARVAAGAPAAPGPAQAPGRVAAAARRRVASIAILNEPSGAHGRVRPRS